MNINALINAIGRHEWLISPEFFRANAFFISQLLNKNFSFEGTDLPPILAADKNGKKTITPGRMDDISPGSVLVVPLIGAMLKHPGMCNYGTVETEQIIVAAAENQNIDAVILNIDSGGGEASSIQPILNGIAALKKAGKQVVALCDTAASAAYWVAAKTDRIFAANDISSVFGSIGAMAQFVDVIPYLEAQGYKVHTVYPPESEEKNKAFRLALEGNYEMIIDEVLSPIARKFIAEMKMARKFNVNDDNHPVFKGKTYSAPDALNIGLIDQIGDLDAAIHYLYNVSPKNAAKMSGIRISDVSPGVIIN